MTPRRLDWQSVRSKLREIERLADVLESFGPLDETQLRGDVRTALAVERAITLLVELAFSVNSHVAASRLGQAPDTYGHGFALAAEAGVIDVALAERLRPSAGLRNILVHAYLKVDYGLVATAVPTAVAGYREYTASVARWFVEIES